MDQVKVVNAGHGNYEVRHRTTDAPLGSVLRIGPGEWRAYGKHPRGRLPGTFTTRREAVDEVWVEARTERLI